jgi:hypothetical protein
VQQKKIAGGAKGNRTSADQYHVTVRKKGFGVMLAQAWLSLQ